MRYCSTRGRAPSVSFEEALLAGLAPDGGLYMPEEWPHFSSADIARFKGQSFAAIACAVLSPFVGDTFTDGELAEMCEHAFANFTHPAVAPLRQIGDDEWILELFHGPTLAFKDVAMQLLGLMFEKVLAKRDQKLTIIGATSGDTGGAAIEALKNKARLNVFILHPEGKISAVQRKIMTTSGAANIFNIAVDGTFDDCQSIVKTLFGEREFAQNVALGGVNSINWARIAIQSVYYFASAVALGAPDRKLSYCVPTGNFGDIFAGFVAHKMGLPIHRLCAATNQNDIVHRVLQTGDYQPTKVNATTSPSMDIQVASNFERLIFEMSGRDSDQVRALMACQKQSGGFTLPKTLFEKMSPLFTSQMASEKEVIVCMKEHFESSSYLIDPHTAVGCVVAKKIADRERDHTGTMVTLSTAHPAKFPESVVAATGQTPSLPKSMEDLYDRPEVMSHCAADPAAIRAFILGHAQTV